MTTKENLNLKSKCVFLHIHSRLMSPSLKWLIPISITHIRPYTKSWKEIKTVTKGNLRGLLSLTKPRKQCWGGFSKEEWRPGKKMTCYSFVPEPSWLTLWAQCAGHCYSMCTNPYRVNECSLLTYLFHTSTYIS